MPDHTSWFHLLLGSFYSKIEHLAAHYLGKPMIGENGEPVIGPDGEVTMVTWLAEEHVSIEPVLATLFVVVILALAGYLISKKFSNIKEALVPDDKFSLSVLIELIVSATYGQLVDMMGKKAAKFFLPLIGTCALLILFSNALGLIPGFLPPTDKLNTTTPYALVIFFSTHIFGVKENGIGYFKHFFGPILKWYALPLMLLMFCIEIISHLARPLSLAIRLAANMTGDHTALTVFLGLVLIVMPFLPEYAALFPIALPIYLLGTIVVIVQTLVFCLLSSVYISLAIAHDEH